MIIGFGRRIQGLLPILFLPFVFIDESFQNCFLHIYMSETYLDSTGQDSVTVMPINLLS
jgi:hypothetical protein